MSIIAKAIHIIPAFIKTSQHPIFGHFLIGGLFIVLAGVWILTGFSPIHDAVGWHGVFHYFYNSVERGVIPYWNPYSQTGTPFLNNFQSFGLLLPLQFIWIFSQKLTGCTTLTTYILFYFSMYYLFIIGTYYTLRIVTGHNGSSLLFSLILFLACFPAFMRQNGALHTFFLFPFITFFLVLFFQEPEIKKKGFYLFILTFLCAVSLNVYIPMWLIFYLILFIVLAILLKVADIQAIFHFLRDRHGLLWLFASILVVVLLASPVAVLYYELRHEPEYFPTLRFLQKNGNNLVKCYASDLQENLFSEKFTRNMKVSLTLGNLVELFLAPFRIFASSEVSVYFGILPLFCVWGALTKVRNRYVYLFSTMAGFIVLILCNFKFHAHAQAGFIQRIMMTLFPFLKMADTLQNGGIILLFCLAAVGVIGFQRQCYENRLLWSIPLVLCSKYLAFALYRSGIAGHQPLLFLLWGGLTIFLLIFLRRKTSLFTRYQAWFKKIPLVVILLLDVFLFDAFQVVSGQVLSKEFFSYLRSEQVLHSKSEVEFTNYRTPFSFQGLLDDGFPAQGNNNNEEEAKTEANFSTFFGHELYHVKKVVFPAAVEKNLQATGSFQLAKHSMQYLRKNGVPEEIVTQLKPLKWKEFDEEDAFLAAVAEQLGEEHTLSYKHLILKSAYIRQYGQERFFTKWDHFYMTTSYYDYLVNVRLDKQLVTSHLIAPILNFFPKKNVILVDNKYDVVEQINRSNLADLATHIFIERDRTIHAPALEIEEFFEAYNFVEYTPEELSGFAQHLHDKYPGNRDVVLEISEYDINHLSLSVDTPYEGYLYFGDGYSKHWKAFVDGKQTNIEKTNINFKSVFTPAGKHQVEFIFDPVLFRYSLYAYFIGNLLFLVVFVICLTKRPTPQTR